MIFRYSVKCPDCEAMIVLRMSVGNDEEQPFYFVCNKCGSATRGKQIIWYEPFPGARIELDEGIVLEQEPEKPDQVISIHPDLPTLKNVESMMEVGGSPFLFNISLLGDRDMEFMGRLRSFRERIDKDWGNVRRWLDHYTERRWEGFKRTGESIFQENWESPPKIWQKHDLLHRAIDVIVAPLWTSDNYPQMKRSWIETWSTGPKVPSGTHELIVKFAHKEAYQGRIVALQRQVFHCLELYINNRSKILPALAISMYPSGVEHAIEDLRIFRDDFPVLRDLYITTFETCHRALLYVLAPVNAAQRGNVEDFGNGTVGFKRFTKKVSAEKTEFLSNVPDWTRRWNLIFNRQLRNRIGHNSIRHELSTGSLVIEGEERIPYTKFLLEVFNLIDGIIIIANVIKSMAIADSMFYDN